MPKVRRIRVASKTAKTKMETGKRGGARVIYLLLLPPGIIYLFYVYTKGDIADLSPEQKKRLRVAMEEIKAQFQP
jgi:hypothetical protein